MKIVNSKAFLAMPEGTVFQKYERVARFSPPMVKGESVISDGDVVDFFFSFFSDIAGDSSQDRLETLNKAEKTGESFPLTFARSERGGILDDQQLYAVWEKEDVLGWILKLTKSLNLGPAVESKLTISKHLGGPVSHTENLTMHDVLLVKYGEPSPFTGFIYTFDGMSEAIVNYIRRVGHGVARGEYGPIGNVRAQNPDDYMAIREDNVAIVITRLDPREDGLYGTIKPSGPMADDFVHGWNQGTVQIGMRCVAEPSADSFMVKVRGIIAFDVVPKIRT